MLNLETQPAESYTEQQPGKSDGVVSFVGLACNEWAGTGEPALRVGRRLRARVAVSDVGAQLRR